MGLLRWAKALLNWIGIASDLHNLLTWFFSGGLPAAIGSWLGIQVGLPAWAVFMIALGAFFLGSATFFVLGMTRAFLGVRGKVKITAVNMDQVHITDGVLGSITAVVENASNHDLEINITRAYGSLNGTGKEIPPTTDMRTSITARHTQNVLVAQIPLDQPFNQGYVELKVEYGIGARPAYRLDAVIEIGPTITYGLDQQVSIPCVVQFRRRDTLLLQ